MPKLLSFGEAIELAKLGQPVSAQSWDFIDRLTGTNEIKEVPASQIWSPENRRIASLLEGPEGSIGVYPYMTKMTRYGIVNYNANNDEMYDVWMPSNVASRCKRFGEFDGEFVLVSELIPSVAHRNHSLPFWMLYDQDMIGYHHNAIFIAGCRTDNLINSVIYNMLSTQINIRQDTSLNDGFDVDSHFCNDGWNDYCDGNQTHYLHLQLDERNFDIDYRITNINKPTNVFIDVDSLNQMNLANGDNAVEYIKAECVKLNAKYPLLNWVAFSRSEEMGNSYTEGDDEIDNDETYALKADQ